MKTQLTASAPPPPPPSLSLMSLEQCRAPGACLVVTVLDHDTLMRDDFEGEAFLAIKAIPGVTGDASRGDEAAAAAPDDEFAFQLDMPPAQIRLPLMHPKPGKGKGPAHRNAVVCH